MIQRFFLDGIHLQCGRCAVTEAIELPVFVDPDEAETRLASVDVAMTRTKITVNSPARLLFPPAGFVQLFSFLEDLQFFHGSSSQFLVYLRTEKSIEDIFTCEKC
jgi:hypothetical protein